MTMAMGVQRLLDLIFGARRHAAPVLRDTDGDWEEIGGRDPYYGVLTDPRFMAGNLTDATRAEFFETGRREIRAQFKRLKRRFPDFKPRSALDFGCGVGRLTRAMGEITGDAVGIDVSEAMLAEARRTPPDMVAFARDLPDRRFDWIVSLIVFQHIPPERGYPLLEALMARLAPDGCVTLQFAVYRDARHANFPGGRITVEGTDIRPVTARTTAARGEMMMFDYDLSVIAAILFAGGLTDLELTHTDHGGFHGVFVQGRKPARSASMDDPPY
jgi:SAM-dependent methyltransferase